MVTSFPTELQFSQKLSGSASDLLKKLKDLHAELKAMEQDSVNTSSLSAITKPLIESSIVNHKDKGVRIYAACCIADLLRLYAPDAPYNNTNLKVIFNLFVRELRHIVNATGPHYNMYYYLLESLSVVKSIVLITDLKNADEIMLELFRNIFDDIRPQQAKNVQICMSELLQHIIDEAENLPQEIVDIILAQFLHKHKFDNPAAYRLACDLGNNCADKLQRYVFQYFLDIISTARNGELSSKEMEDFKTVHKLVIELNKATPALLLNVIPQLEEEMKLTDVSIRSLATKSLGEMFAEKTSQLATQYESTWKAWLLRRNDKVPQVRIIWVASAVKLIKTHGSLDKELNGMIAISLQMKRALPKNLDKKKAVSKEAIKSLSVLYSQAYPEIENGIHATITHFGWMPSAILHAVYVNDAETFSFVDHAILAILFPPHGSTESRTLRLVKVFTSLDEKGRTGFLSVLRRCVDARYYMTAFLRLLRAHEASSKDSDATEFERKLGAVIKALSDRLPDPVKSSVVLSKFAKARDDKFLVSISSCMNSRSSLKDIKKAVKETLERIENVTPTTLEVFSILLERISLMLLNYEVVSQLIRNVDESEEHRQASGELLRYISLIFPAIFKDHLIDITALLRDPEFAGASDSLHTLAEFAKSYPKSVPANANVQETLEAFLEVGTVTQATHAMIVLASVPDNDSKCLAVAELVADRLDVSSPRLLKDLSVLSQLALYSPQSFEKVSHSVVAFIIKTLLMTNTPEQEIMGLKVLVNRAIMLLESDPGVAQDAVRPVFKLLWTLLSEEGELVAKKNTNAVMKSHLRLNAARLVIKLTRGNPTFEKMVSVADYRRLALVMQDPIFGVRQGFATRVMKYIRSKELHIRYLTVLFLGAHEPELEWRQKVRGFLIQQSKSQAGAEDSKLMLNELSLARLLHLLANHPDFVIMRSNEDNVFAEATKQHSVDDLNLTARYIEFYLETITNSENVSLIFYIATLLKTVRLVNLNEDTQNLYILSDLTQYLVQERSRSHNWILTSYPGQVKLPRELFAPLGHTDLSVEISKKNYLSLEWVHSREHKTERKSKAAVERKIGQAAKRRSRSPSPSEAVSGENVDDIEGVTSPARVKRPKKTKTVERITEGPTRRMASRAAKANTVAYKDAETSEEEDDDV
ncbi:hypothetical protein BGZ75_008067 [Mortierella antarctica]|nr:hypothetical protein BGZ75_008067 [Mortierella antarctica]